MASVLNQHYFHDEKAAFEALEGIMWPGGKPVYGLWKCYGCRQQFTVRKGTIFEESHLELHLWFQAAHLMCSSKKGVSANQLHRMLGCTLKTAWFVGHRLREAMRDGGLAVPFGSTGGMVEVDETYIGHQKGKPKKRAFHHKMKVLTLVDRETRQARSVIPSPVAIAIAVVGFLPVSILSGVNIGSAIRLRGAALAVAKFKSKVFGLFVEAVDATDPSRSTWRR